MNTANARPGLRRRIIVLLYGLLAVGFLGHTWLTFRFTAGEALLDSRPFSYGDYSLHYYDAMRARQSIAETGSLWSWDPRFMAGYPAGVFDAVSNRPAEVLLAVAPGPPGVLFKLWVVFTILVTPLLAMAAAGLLRTPAPVVAMSGALSLLFVHFDTRLFTFLRRGLFQFPFAAAVTTVAVAATLDFADRPTWKRALLSGVALGLTLFCHPTTAVLLAPVCLLLVYTAGRRFPIQLLSIAGIALAPNLGWLHGLFVNRSLLGVDSGFWSSTDQSLMAALSDPGAGVRNGLVVAALLSSFLHRERSLAVLTATSLVCCVAGFTGSSLPLLTRLEPGRFVLAAAFFAVIPAATLLYASLEVRRASLLAGVAALVGLLPLLSGARFELLPNFLRFTLPLNETPDADALVQALSSHTDRTGRVLLDQDWPGSHHLGFIGCHLGLRVDREFMGGPHPWVKVTQNAANSSAGYFIGRRLAELADVQLGETFALYNIRWAVSRDRELRKRLAAYPIAHSLAVAGEWELFSVGHPTTYFLEGEGSVVSGLDRIEVVPATAARVVLRYHWHPSMRAEGQVTVTPFPVPGAPVPFIAATGHDGRPFIIDLRR